MDPRWRPALELPAIAVAALLCAWISNAFAGPTRRLSWMPERTQVVVMSQPTSAPVPTPITRAPETPHAKIAPKPAAPKVAEVPDWDPAALLARFPPLQGQISADVTGDEAHWLQTHGALILDARRSDVYALGHLPGAKCLPVWEDGLQEKITRLAAEHGDPILPVLVYCAGGSCEDSHLLAQKLWMAGYRNLRIYAGGFPHWETKGWPIHRGEQP